MGRAGLLLRLAWRNLWRNARRTVILLLAVTLGVAAMVFAAAFSRGMVVAMVDDAIDHLPGHVQIHAPGYRDDPAAEHRFPYPQGRLRAVLDGPLVAAWAARVRVPVVVASEYDTAGVTLLGVEPRREAALAYLARAPVDGRPLAEGDDPGLLIGRRLAERLDTDRGRRVVITGQGTDGSLADRGFRVVGLFRSPWSSEEKGIALTGLATAQRLLRLPGEVNEVAVRAADPERLEALVAALRAAAPELEVADWRTLSPLTHAGQQLYSQFTWVWYLVVFLGMAFGLVNTLLMAVLERTREFGLFLALGMRPRWILGQVWFEALLVLVLGLAAGNGLALALARALGEVDVSAFAAGAELAGLAQRIPLIIHGGDLALANGLVLALGLAAALYPAWRAARLAPVRALRRN